MSGYQDLRDLGVQFGPFDGPAPRGANRYSQFSASWGMTVELLARELVMLDARAIVIELDIRTQDWRIDGLPRANAVANSPAVRVTFTSKWGPLRYETAEYQHWQDNVRAIAKSMEALRMVDRYGVSKRGEQYRGWKALPTGTDPADAIATPEIAREFLAQWGGDWKAAVKDTHPDVGGDPTEYRKVLRARELVG